MNRLIGSAILSLEEDSSMSILMAGRWLETHLRLMALREVAFDGLVEAVAQRDRMLGGVGYGATGRLPWGRLDSEEDDIAFFRNLAEGHGFGAPLGDRIALAVRVVANLRSEQISASMAEILVAWFDQMQHEEDEDASLRVVFDVLRGEVSRIGK